MNQLSLFQKTWVHICSVQWFSISRNLYLLQRKISNLKVWIVLPWMVLRVPVYCFLILTSNIKKALKNICLENVVVHFLLSDQAWTHLIFIFLDNRSHFPRKRLSEFVPSSSQSTIFLRVGCSIKCFGLNTLQRKCKTQYLLETAGTNFSQNSNLFSSIYRPISFDQRLLWLFWTYKGVSSK